MVAGEQAPPAEDLGVDISPNKDGGLYKKIIKEGTGDETPATGNKVTVHYTGTLLDGTKFDSSKDRNEPFEFALGRGSVIKGWDVGVATMKRGEVCMLTCRSDFAYGSNGSPPTIPPDATLQFEVEMIDWQGEDLSPNKRGGIIRTQLVAGEGYGTPNDGAQVEVHIVGRYEGKVFEDRVVNFTLGEGSEDGVIEGVEIALEKFKRGEKSRLKIKPQYAFKDGKAEFNIPANATVEYDVELRSFEKETESWSLDLEGKLKQAQLYKEKGTKYFKANNLKLAQKMYKKMVDYLDDPANPQETNEQKQTESQTLQTAAYLNLALCMLKQGENKEAVEQCDKALEIDSNNEKGLFRRGQAYLALGEPERARQDFEAVVKLAPENKAAANNIVICNTQIKEQRKKEKKIYANMFEKFAQKDREEKLSHFGWWDGTRPITPPPLVSEETEDALREAEEAKKQKKQFIETVKKRKMEMAKFKEEKGGDDVDASGELSNSSTNGEVSLEECTSADNTSVTQHCNEESVSGEINDSSEN